MIANTPTADHTATPATVIEPRQRTRPPTARLGRVAHVSEIIPHVLERYGLRPGDDREADHE